MNNSAYGEWCPTCGAPGISRERRLDGYTSCIEGHRWKSGTGSKSPGVAKDKDDSVLERTTEIIKWFTNQPVCCEHCPVFKKCNNKTKHEVEVIGSFHRPGDRDKCMDRMLEFLKGEE